MPIDSRNKWFLRLAAEGAVIVVSILLAFAIDAWWADRQEEVEETRILSALLADFNSTQESVRELRKYREAKIASISRLLEAAAGTLVLSPTQIDGLLGDLLDAGTVDFSSGALASLFEGGGLAKIQNQNLRQRLTSFTYLIDWTKDLEEPTRQRQNMHWNPFFWSNSYYPQIENAKGRIPGLEIENATPQIPIRERRDHSSILDNDEFTGMLATELGSQSTLLRWYAKLEREIEQVTEIIESELSQR
mgnify:CR=1 FL=1